jgi:chloramphenicol 3-O phosphotransferase
LLVWLLGGSSTGKSSIARQMLALAQPGEAWIVTGDEHITTRIPRRLLAPGALTDPPTNDGWDIVVDDGQLVALPQVGPVGLRILEAMYRGAAAMAAADVRVILEDVIWDPAVRDLGLTALGDAPKLVVEVRCDFEVRLERERRRGDRFVGAVAAFAAAPPVAIEPDLCIDTTERTAADCAAEIVEVVRKRAAHWPLT